MSGAVVTDRFRPALAIIAGGAAAVRFVYVLVAKGGNDVCGAPLCGDAVYYAEQARFIAAGRFFEDPFNAGMPAADHPPLTALLMAPVSLLTNHSLTAQRLTMAVIGVASVVVIGLLARAVAGDRAGLIAAAAAALYPNLWVNDGLIMAEGPATLATATALLLLYRYLDRPGPGRAALVGLAAGIGVLARAEMALLLVIVIIPTMVLHRSEWRRALTAVAVAGLVSAAVVAPWVAFNLARFEEPTFLSTNDGITLAGANCDGVYSGPGVGVWRLDCATNIVAEGDQSQISATWRAAAFDYIWSHQKELPALWAIRLGRTWSIYAPDQMAWYNQGEGRETWVSWAGFWVYVGLVPAALAGSVILWRRRVPIWPLVGPFLVVSMVTVLFYGIIRFRISAEVTIVVLAAAALDAALSRWRRSSDLSPATDAAR